MDQTKNVKDDTRGTAFVAAFVRNEISKAVKEYAVEITVAGGKVEKILDELALATNGSGGKERLNKGAVLATLITVLGREIGNAPAGIRDGINVAVGFSAEGIAKGHADLKKYSVAELKEMARKVATPEEFARLEALEPNYDQV